jgi:2-polyprenyl-3-methyl-5-hydroxy-6-metoxy-1,4-benzoquinol methylase
MTAGRSYDLGMATGSFIAHSIELADGRRTIPDKPLLAETPFTRAVLRTMELAFCGRPHQEISVIDLGCLEGGYTVEFARAGYQATGLEVRQANLDRCSEVQESLSLPNLRFVLDDARNLADYGSFDAVFCAGLLYHLDNPVSFLDTVSKSTKRLLVLDTHVAMARRPRYWRKRLSRMTEHEGVPGRWYRDYTEGASQQAVEGALTASFGNPRSFWIEKMNLIQTLRNVGFTTIYEQFDCLSDIVDNVRLRVHDRVLLVALK